MSPRTPEQFEQIRESKKQLIMDTALRLFADEGFHTISISRIAREANISKGLMYNYFESKEQLLLEIIDIGFNEMLALFDPNKDGILEVHEMKFYIESTFNLIKKNTGFWRLYFRITFQSDVFPYIKKRIDDIFEPVMKMMIEYFSKKGYEDPYTEAFLFGALMDGVAMDYVFSPEFIPIDKIKDAIIKKYC